VKNNEKYGETLSPSPYEGINPLDPIKKAAFAAFYVKVFVELFQKIRGVWGETP